MGGYQREDCGGEKDEEGGRKARAASRLDLWNSCTELAGLRDSCLSGGLFSWTGTGSCIMQRAKWGIWRRFVDQLRSILGHALTTVKIALKVRAQATIHEQHEPYVEYM
jgi:hypothetical protein